MPESTTKPTPDDEKGNNDGGDPTADVASAAPPVVDEPPATNVHEALCRLMRDIPGIGKGTHASEKQGGYAYRGIEAITAEVQPLMARHRVRIHGPKVISHDVDDVIVNNNPWTDTTQKVMYWFIGPGGYEIVYPTVKETRADGTSVERTDTTDWYLTGDVLPVGPLVGIGRDNTDKGSNKVATQVIKYALIQNLVIGDKNDETDGKSPERDSGTGATSRGRGRQAQRGRRSSSEGTREGGNDVTEEERAALQLTVSQLPEDLRAAYREQRKARTVPPITEITERRVFNRAKALANAQVAEAAKRGDQPPPAPAEPPATTEPPAEPGTAPAPDVDPLVESTIATVRTMKPAQLNAALSERGYATTGNETTRRKRLVEVLLVEAKEPAPSPELPLGDDGADEGDADEGDDED